MVRAETIGHPIDFEIAPESLTNHRARKTRTSITTIQEELNKMASGDLIVGLEIGTSKICVVVGETRPDGTLRILGVGQAPSRGVRKLPGFVITTSRAS